jgi:hypothetical protein
MKKGSVLFLFFVFIYIEIVNGQSLATTAEPPGEIEYTYTLHRLSDHEFNVKFSLYSEGAESFTVTTVEWNSGFMFTKIYEEGPRINFTSFNFSYGEEIQFRFKASNPYGHRETRFDLPFEEYRDLFTSLTEVGENLDILLKTIDIYSLRGVYVGTIRHRSKLEQTCVPGIFILRYKDVENRVLRTEKVIIK